MKDICLHWRGVQDPRHALCFFGHGITTRVTVLVLFVLELYLYKTCLSTANVASVSRTHLVKEYVATDRGNETRVVNHRAAPLGGMYVKYPRFPLIVVYSVPKRFEERLRRIQIDTTSLYHHSYQ